jgi:AcrR family transcriptional regulator
MSDRPKCEHCGRPMELSSNENYWFCPHYAGHEAMVKAMIEQALAEKDKQLTEVIRRLTVAEAERDSWRRVAERLEGENQSLKARVETLEAALPLWWRLELLADWFDMKQERDRPTKWNGNEVQKDLRRWARNIKAALNPQETPK